MTLLLNYFVTWDSSRRQNQPPPNYKCHPPRKPHKRHHIANGSQASKVLPKSMLDILGSPSLSLSLTPFPWRNIEKKGTHSSFVHYKCVFCLELSRMYKWKDSFMIFWSLENQPGYGIHIVTTGHQHQMWLVWQ